MKKIAPKNEPGKGGRGPGRGRKSIRSGEDPILEERVEFVADLVAGRRSRGEICVAIKERFGLGSEITDRYIAEVRRRWQIERDKGSVAEKRQDIIKALQRVSKKAEERITYGEDGTPRHNPDLWLVRQIEIDIAKIEGVFEGNMPTDGDVDTVINDLAAERKAENPAAGIDRS